MVSLLQANEQLDGFTCMSGMSANATSERLFFFFYINKGSTRPFLLETRATHRFSREERKNKTGDWGTVKTKEVQPKV